MNEIGKRLKDLREDKKLSQAELAKAFGKSQVAISKYENGNRKVDYDTLNKYAEFFQVSTDYLLGTAQNAINSHVIENNFKNSGNSTMTINNINNQNKELSSDDIKQLKDKQLDHATYLINLYVNAVEVWSDNQFFSDSEKIRIKEHFADLILKYKQVINALADSKLRYRDYLEKHINSGLSESEIKEQFFKLSTKKQIRDLDNWIKALPNYVSLEPTEK